MSIYIGIDNGISGGLAAYESDSQQLVVVPMPIVQTKVARGIRNEYNIPAIIGWLAEREFNTVVSDNGRVTKKVAMVILERAQPYPGQGSVSNFTIGRCFGILEGVLSSLKLPYTVVHPKTWQKRMFEGVAHGDTKQASILVAQRTFPNARFIASEKATKLHNGMTDAALMAYYGYLLHK